LTFTTDFTIIAGVQIGSTLNVAGTSTLVNVYATNITTDQLYSTSMGDVNLVTYIQNVSAQANSSVGDATFAADQAGLAYTRANNSISANTGGTITGDLTVTGNLFINGTTTTINTSIVQTADSLIKLASNNTVSDTLDIGFYGVANTAGSSAPTYHGLVRQAGTNNFLLFKGLTQDPSSNVISPGSATAANVGTLIANVAAFSITSGTIVASSTITGSNLSGTNTGDNAVNSLYSGLVTNATHTGDATGATALTLATVNSNVGTWNNVTVNAKGLVTAGSNAAYVATTGDQTVGGIKTFTSTAAFTGTHILIKNGASNNSTAIHRVDGTNYYILMSNVSTAASATWNALRPFTINQTSGLLTSSNGQAFTGGLSTSSLTSTGNVGIGTASPSQKLHVFSTTNYQGILVSGSAAPTIGFVQNSGTDQTWKAGISGLDGTAFSIGQGTGGTDSLIITTGNNVGIGVTAPSAPLHIIKSGGSTTTPNLALILDYESDTTSLAGGGTAIEFRGKSGSGNLANYSQARIRSVTYEGNNSHGIALDYKPSAAGALTEGLRISDGGNVGIGTSTPAVRLDIAGAGTAVTQLIWARGNADAAFVSSLRTGDAGSSAYQSTIGVDYAGYTDFSRIKFYRASTTGEIHFYTGGLGANGTEKMRLMDSGNLGIGTSAPATTLSATATRHGNADGLSAHLNAIQWEVNGQGYASVVSNISVSSGQYNAGLLVKLGSTDVTDKILDLESGGVNRVRVLGNGNVGIGTASPTQKLEVAGTVYSTSGGFKFPDGTVQASAASGGGGGVSTGKAIAMAMIFGG
jgi:hypothetical protein